MRVDVDIEDGIIRLTRFGDGFRLDVVDESRKSGLYDLDLTIRNIQDLREMFNHFALGFGW